MNRAVSVALFLLTWQAFAAESRSCAPLRIVSKPEKAASQPLVSIYWDVSGSVDQRFNPHVDFLIANIDSRILQLAGAGAPIRHYAVGESIVEAHDASVAASRHQMRSALHDASRAIAADLARGTIGAAILVTDLEVDRPEIGPNATAVCGDVPVPTDRSAGPLIGRCFSAGWRLTPTPPGGHKPTSSINHLLLTIFRSRYAVPTEDGISRRHLYILVFATDIEFGRKILAGFEQRLASLPQGYDRFNVVDTPHTPNLTVDRTILSRSVRTARGYDGRCAFACYDASAALDLEIAIRPAPATAWVTLQPKPRIPSADGTARPVLRSGNRWNVVWRLSCVTPRRTFAQRHVDLQFNWEAPQAIPSSVTIDHPNVEDAITSLLQAVPPLLAPRVDTVTIGLR